LKAINAEDKLELDGGLKEQVALRIFIYLYLPHVDIAYLQLLDRSALVPCYSKRSSDVSAASSTFSGSKDSVRSALI